MVDSVLRDLSNGAASVGTTLRAMAMGAAPGSDDRALYAMLAQQWGLVTARSGDDRRVDESAPRAEKSSTPPRMTLAEQVAMLSRHVETLENDDGWRAVSDPATPRDGTRVDLWVLPWTGSEYRVAGRWWLAGCNGAPGRWRTETLADGLLVEWHAGTSRPGHCPVAVAWRLEPPRPSALVNAMHEEQRTKREGI